MTYAIETMITLSMVLQCKDNEKVGHTLTLWCHMKVHLEGVKCDGHVESPTSCHTHSDNVCNVDIIQCKLFACYHVWLASCNNL